MTRTTRSKPRTRANTRSRVQGKLLTLARKGERTAYLQLFMSELTGLDRFIRHEIRYSETIGAVERGLIDPCAVVDQVYIAALNTLTKMPAKMSFHAWLRYLALHIMRQQIRIEHKQEPVGVNIERSIEQDGTVDTDLWEYYQPDDVTSVEDALIDRTAPDPEELMEMQEAETELEETIDQLPPALRELLRLRKIEGLSLEELAAIKNKPQADIRQTLQEACAALKNLTAARQPR